MAYRLACADFTFPLLPHDQALQLIAMLGFEGVDIGLFEERSHLWPSREFARGAATSARTLRARLEEKGLQAADIFLQMGTDFAPYALNHPLAEPRAKARDWFLRTLDYAAESGSRHVTALPGVTFAQEAPETSLARAVEELAWRVGQAVERQLTFAVEAHVGSIIPDPAAAEALLRRVPGLTLTLDYTHFTRAGLPDAAVEPLIPYASHCHLRGACEGRLQTSFANSTIDYRRMLRLMAASGYAGWLGVEYVWQDWEHCNECDNLSEVILFRDFLRSLPDR